MVRLIDRTWRPVFALLIGVALVFAVLGLFRAHAQVQSNQRRIEELEGQIRSLGGDPRAPVVVNVPAPQRSPTPTLRESPRDQPTPAPARASLRPTRSPSSPTGTPSPSTTCVRVSAGPTNVGGCL